MGATQNELTDALTSAIQTIAESNAQSTEATLTVEAEIVDIIDEGLGIYKVKYLGNQFEATTASTEISYDVGDMVYVVVPNGNFDKNKIILSPVNSSSIAYADTQEDVSYIPLGDNLFKNINDVSLCTYKPYSADDPGAIVTIDTTGFAALFQAALTDSRAFNFTCKIQTNIERERRSKGNYGLILDIPVTQIINGVKQQRYYSVTADINNIIGDPYDLSVPSLQNFYFTLPEDMDYDSRVTPRIRSFIYDFIGEDNTKPDDIFITDIQLLSVLEVSKETMSGYYAVVTASGGNSFLASRTGDTKTLSVTAYLNGKVTKNSNFDCYWFKENVAINNNSDKFQRFGGLGWEILNKVSEKNYAEDGKITYQYVTNIYTQEVLQEEIHCDTRFKCVLVKSDKVVSAIITIKNLASDAKIELTSISGSNTFSAGTGNVELQLKYSETGITDIAEPNFIIGYSWERLDKRGNYIDNDFYIIDEFNKKEDDTYYTKIHFPVNKIDEVNTVSCTVYIETPINNDLVKRQIIGTEWIVLSIGEPLTGHIEIANGDKLYKYDADGDSPMVADYDGPLTSAVKSITPISIKIYKEDGTELISDEYSVVDVSWLVPVNSMIKLTAAQKTDTTTNPGYYTISGKYPANNQLSYGISNTYNKNKLDNNIIIQASAPSAVLKKPISNIATIRFLKDGEGGTNGSKYSAILTYNGYGYGERDANGKIHKIQLIYVHNDSVWYLYDPSMPGVYTLFTSATLVPVLYADGDVVASTPTTTWNIFDSNYNYNDDLIVSPVSVSNGVISLNGNNWTSPNDKFCATIEAKVKASRTSTITSQTNSDEYIYAYYPIECSHIYSTRLLKSFMPTLEGGFSKVLYAADGTNPQYDNSENFYIVDPNYGKDISDLCHYSWSTSSNMRVSNTNTEPTCKITPTSKYDNGVAKNYVRVSITRDDSQVAVITNERDILVTEKTAEENLLNYYQTLQNNIDIFGNFDYNDYVESLTEASYLFIVKTDLIKTAEKLLNQIDILKALCDEYKIIDGGSTDSKVMAVYNEAVDKTTDLNNLNELCNELGTTSNIINQIKAITPINLTIVNKIPYTNGIPDRSCYFTINSNIDLYNNIVNTLYSNYLELLDETETITCDTAIQDIIEDLKDFANSQKLENLTETYSGCNEEAYRYKALVQNIKNRINSSSIQANTYSYNLFIENVLNPIYDSISWYITFYNNGGYNSLITEKTNKISDLEDRITILNDMISGGRVIDVIHVKPIIMVYNRYELSHINGWDGNKLETGDGYLIAPQVGAGKKDSFNQFTGIVIGVKQVQERSTTGQKIGMFGYSSGAQSMFLNAEDGSALFGKSGKGQIIIDPSHDAGLLYSGNFWKNYGTDGKPTSYEISNYNKLGMLIDLTTPEIRFGNGNFVVNQSGHVTAAGGGSIAGWNIDDSTISSKISVSNGKMVIDSGAYVSGYNAKGEKIYTASEAGKIYTGNHSTISSTDKGFYLSQNGLSITGRYDEVVEGTTHTRTSRIELNTAGNPKIFSGGHSTLNSNLKGFYLSQDGLSICNGIRSRIELNMSGDPKLYSNNHDSLYSNNDGFYLGNDGLSIGQYFRVTDEGIITATNADLTGEINATSGTIAGWTIESNYLYCDGLSIYPPDSIIRGTGGSIDFGGPLELHSNESIYFNGDIRTEDHYATSGDLEFYDYNGNYHRIACQNGIIYSIT